MRKLNHEAKNMSDVFGISREDLENLVEEVVDEFRNFSRFDTLSKIIENFPVWLSEGSESKILTKYLVILKELCARR